jgi:uncharacterized protein
MTNPIRRAAALTAALVLAAPALADEPVELAWEQLVPAGAVPATPAPWGVVQHGQLDPAQPTAGDDPPPALVADFDGRRVRLGGFVVPLGFEGDGVTEFLLVPFVGACIHVPPPPPNQIVHVRSAEPVAVRGAFDPVYVTGTLTSGLLASDLAEVGYRIAADEVSTTVQDRPRFLFEPPR